MELAAKSGCFFFVTYTASALTTQTWTVTITDQFASRRSIVKLSGKGKAPKK